MPNRKMPLNNQIFCKILGIKLKKLLTEKFKAPKTKIPFFKRSWAPTVNKIEHPKAKKFCNIF